MWRRCRCVQRLRSWGPNRGYGRQCCRNLHLNSSCMAREFGLCQVLWLGACTPLDQHEGGTRLLLLELLGTLEHRAARILAAAGIDQPGVFRRFHCYSAVPSKASINEHLGRSHGLFRRSEHCEPVLSPQARLERIIVARVHAHISQQGKFVISLLAPACSRSVQGAW